ISRVQVLLPYGSFSVDRGSKHTVIYGLVFPLDYMCCRCGNDQGAIISPRRLSCRLIGDLAFIQPA
ncbi:MAG: hypothetical protein ABIP88_02865, partial [Candidatus Binatia bacterium]